MQYKYIEISKAREHNLKEVSLKIPRDKFTVFTGISGSGKSSLAFDTLYAQGYRMYMESLSANSRRILEQVDKPDVDYIKGISPVIAIEQNPVNTSPRSTVATSTEIADYARIIWSVAGKQICPLCEGEIKEQTTDECVEKILELGGKRIYILANKLSCKAPQAKQMVAELAQGGWQRVRINGKIYEIDECEYPKRGEVDIDIVIDRLVVEKEEMSRIADSMELAFKEGNASAIILYEDGDDFSEMNLSNKLACQNCFTRYNEISSRLFSHNHPEGACPHCHGIGKVMKFLPELIVPDENLTLKNGAIKALRIGGKSLIMRNNSLLRQLSAQVGFDLNTPWKDLDKEHKDFLMYGDENRILAIRNRGGNVKPVMRCFEGVIAMLEHFIIHTSSDNMRMRLMLCQVSSKCPQCGGSRLSKRARSVFIEDMSYDKFMALSVLDALNFIKNLDKDKYKDILEAIKAIESRLNFLNETALSYLSLNREFSTLSGGEEQRVRLATQFGMGLTGVTYVLDEPSIGLHPSDNIALINSLKNLRDLGNTLVVVEHDEYAIRQADHIVELGPLAGQAGGQIIFEGTPKECEKSKKSLTGLYLSGKRKLLKPSTDFNIKKDFITVKGAKEHNLKNITAKFAIGAFNIVCGVSGSGKSTLVNDILAKHALFKLNRAKEIAGKHSSIDGLDSFDKCIVVDQSPIGKSPRSNPATYTKIFDEFRNLYSSTTMSKARGYKAGRFSFNVKGGRCEHCSGDGQIALDMQFLGQVYVKCPNCLGNRYNRETLQVRYKGLNIAELLDLSITEACQFFRSHEKIARTLCTLEEVGLGYLKLGQASNTLSGGEAQRIKLSLELSKRQRGKNLYILDEPTTGLHFDDIEKLARLMFKLRDAGNTLIVIEHHTDLIAMADYILELGESGGENGGRILFQGNLKDFKKVDTPTSFYIKNTL